MAKVKVPAKEIEVCDCCGRDGYLMDCKSCAGKYCVMCQATITGCMHRLDVCKTCGKIEEVLAIAEKYSPHFVELVEKRNKELEALQG